MNALLALVILSFAACNKAPEKAEIAAVVSKSWHATGTIKSFGPNKSFVNIAHEDIPGYMKAMTMSFEPSKPEQLASLSVGDRVSFDFTETDDARRVISQIQKL